MNKVIVQNYADKNIVIINGNLVSYSSNDGEVLSGGVISPELFQNIPISNSTGGGVSPDTKFGNPLGDRVDNSSGVNLADGSAESKPVITVRGGGGGTFSISSKPSWLYTN
jgi:hypothetical protein